MNKNLEYYFLKFRGKQRTKKDIKSLQNSNDHAGALAKIETAKKVFRKTGDFHTIAARYYKKSDQFSQALCEVKAGLEIKPASFPLRVLLADIYRLQGETEKAVLEFTKLPVNSLSVNQMSLITTFAVSIHDRSLAESVLEQTNEKTRALPAYYVLVELPYLLMIGEDVPSSDRFANLPLDTLSLRELNFLTRHLSASNFLNAALIVLHAGMEHRPSISLQFLIADIHRRLGETEKAVIEFSNLPVSSLSVNQMSTIIAFAVSIHDSALAKSVLRDANEQMRVLPNYYALVELPYLLMIGEDVVSSDKLKNLPLGSLSSYELNFLASRLSAAGFVDEALSVLQVGLNHHLESFELMALNYKLLRLKSLEEANRYFSSIREKLNDVDFLYVVGKVPIFLRSKADNLAYFTRLFTDDSFENYATKDRLVDNFLAAPDHDTVELIISYLMKNPNSVGKLGVLALRNHAADLEEIKNSVVFPASWNNFRNRQNEMFASIRDFANLSNQTVEALKSMQAADFAWLFTSNSAYDAVEFAKWIALRIRKKTPTSIIRLGDGEGNFLPYITRNPELQIPDAIDIQKNVWWGECLAKGPDMARLAGDLMEAIDGADTVGVPTIFQTDKGSTANNRDSRGVTAVWDYVAKRNDMGRPVKRLVSNFFHIDFFNWRLYDMVFAETDSVSVVSCHDLSDVLERRFGLATRTHIRLSPEQKYSDVFSLDGTPTEKIYPDQYEKIMGEVAPLAGEVWLVAAGLLGKPICNKIKALGGIAIDIGSVADIWQGHTTRDKANIELNFDWSTSMIAGLGISKDTGTPKDKLIAKAFSGRTDYNLNGGAAPAVPELDYKIRVIGHPRCGSGFVATSLRCFDLDIYHEKFGADGICSWMNAVENDPIPPWGPELTENTKFRFTLGFVRNPASALPSIVIENGDPRSFAFRRKHIFKEIGVDIADWPTPFERAVASYVFWTDIVKMKAPPLTLRIESFLDDICLHKEILSDAGLMVTPENLKLAQSVSTTTNATANKSTLAEFKPSLQELNTNACSIELKTKLGNFCEEHKYEFPF